MAENDWLGVFAVLYTFAFPTGLAWLLVSPHWAFHTATFMLVFLVWQEVRSDA